MQLLIDRKSVSYLQWVMLGLILGALMFKGWGCWSRKCCAHFSTHSFHCTFIMISMKNMEKKSQKISRGTFRWKMATILDFRALTKVLITLKPLLQLQCKVACIWKTYYYEKMYTSDFSFVKN